MYIERKRFYLRQQQHDAFKNPSPRVDPSCALTAERPSLWLRIPLSPRASGNPTSPSPLRRPSRPLATLPATAMTTLDLAARIGAHPAKIFSATQKFHMLGRMCCSNLLHRLHIFPICYIFLLINAEYLF